MIPRLYCTLHYLSGSLTLFTFHLNHNRLRDVCGRRTQKAEAKMHISKFLLSFGVLLLTGEAFAAQCRNSPQRKEW